MEYIMLLEKGTEYSLIPTVVLEGYATLEEIRSLRDKGWIIFNADGSERL